MTSPGKYEHVWSELELAVRTHSERLPVDAFLPDPKDRVAEILEARAVKRKCPQPREEVESGIQEDTFQEILDETEIVEPVPPVHETPNIEDELRQQLSGDGFAELDDVF